MKLPRKEHAKAVNTNGSFKEVKHDQCSLSGSDRSMDASGSSFSEQELNGADQTVSVPGNAKRLLGLKNMRKDLLPTNFVTAGNGALITADGRFDLDLLAFVQHPAEFEMETGEIIPNVHPGCGGEEAKKKHSQNYFRLYNQKDGIYRTLLFAKERGREVRIENFGNCGIKVVTPEYTDYVFMHNDVIDESCDGVCFVGRVGWIRRDADGKITACVPDGDLLQAFGIELEARGPWTYNMGDKKGFDFKGPTPQTVT